MRDLVLEIPADDRPVYLRLAQAVREAIRKGFAQPGEAIPSTRSLARAAGVHRHTVMAALDELVAEGWLSARPGQAYRVEPDLPDPYFRPATKPAARSAPKPQGAFPFRIVRSSSRPAPEQPLLPYRFQGGLPDLRLFPADEFRSHVADMLRTGFESHLTYGDVAGFTPFLRTLGTYLRRLRGLHAPHLLVTHGSQEAAFLVGQLLISPGDVVAVEALGYPPTWNALAAAGAHLVGLAVDEAGLVPEDFARLCSRRRVRLLCLTPLHQYPTTVTLPVARRMEIYRIAQKHGVPILEDDYDHEYHYRCQPLPPLASEDPQGLVLYVSTFSKVLYPAARVGFMAVPQGLFKPLSELKRFVSRQNDSLIQGALARWMEEGGFSRHLRRMRRTYAERLDALVAVLEEARASGVDLSWRTPDGGMALWLKIPWDAERAAAAARASGVLVHPEPLYQLRPGAGRHLRLGFANLTPAEIRAGMKRLLAACARLPASRQ
jgi:GntR family transcriptional regulator/MocR family aminotransferase